MSTWDTHLSLWRDCARCRHVNWRVLLDKDRKKVAGQVPFALDGEHLDDLVLRKAQYELTRPPKHRPVLFLLSAPDESQEASGNLAGQYADSPEVTSPSVLTLARIMYDLSKNGFVQYGPGDVAYSLALGCRPVNYTDARKLVSVAAQEYSACETRWIAEAMMVDPYMIVACGVSAFGALHRSDPKASTYAKYLGEVIVSKVQWQGTTYQVPVYVAPDPHQAHSNATSSAWDIEMSGSPSPPDRKIRHPIQSLRWHMYRALTLARACELGRTELVHDAGAYRHLREMTQRLDAFHNDQSSEMHALQMEQDWIDRVGFAEQRVATSARNTMMFLPVVAGELESTLGDIDGIEDDFESDDESEDQPETEETE